MGCGSGSSRCCRCGGGAIGVLGVLRGIGVPVASAVLAIVEPAKYGVIDFRGWRRLFGTEKTAFSVSDYKDYLAELRRLAGELGWRVRDVDEAVWELDRRMSTPRGRKGK
jgi:hypothetical protein